MRRSASARIMGCRSCSSARFAAGSLNTRSRIASRSIAPLGLMNASPKSALMCASAAPPGAVSSCAIASVSTTEAPRRSNSRAAVLLPPPMPPVRPTTKVTKGRESKALGVPVQDRRAPVKRDQRRDRDVGPEVKAKAGVPAAARYEHLQRAEDEAYQRGKQDHERQHLPPEERA